MHPKYYVRMSWLFEFLPTNFMYHTTGNTAIGAYTWYCPTVSEGNTDDKLMY